MVFNNMERGEDMNKLKNVLIILLFIVMAPFSAVANDLKDDEKMIEGVDAYQALSIANQWKWTHQNIKSYVTPKEVVFEFPGNRIKKVALPEDQMVVAIAPYLSYTHG